MMLINFPKVPKKEQPKALYIASLLSEEEEKLAKSLGWKPVDVRLLPNNTDAERAEAVKCWFEGVRQGSIEPAKGVLSFLEVEARIYGLFNTKQAGTVKHTKEEDTDVLELLKGIRSDRAFKGTWDPTIAKQ